MKTLPLITIFVSAIASTLAAGCMDDTIQHSGFEVSGRPYFEVFESTASGEFYFHLAGGNHEIILSSEGYNTRTGALGGALSVLNHGFDSRNYDVEKAANGEYYYNLVAVNGEIIGTSETYVSKSNANKAVNDAVAAINDYLTFRDNRTGERFEVFVGNNGEYFFSLHAANGERMLRSEGYKQEASALNGTFSVAENGLDADKYEIKEGQHGGFYFNLKAANGEVIGTSEMYDTKFNAERARDTIIDLLPGVELL